MNRSPLLSGQSIVELLVVVGISAVLLPALAAAFIIGRDSRPQTTQRSYALGLVAEGFEAARAVRDESWSGIAVDGTYHTVMQNGSWQLATGSATIQSYTRSVIIAPVYRNSSGGIAQSGGTIDPSSKYITSTVSWLTPRSSSLSETMILTRYKDNLAYIQTTKADFDLGTLAGTSTSSTNGGEVFLGSGGGGDWCGPDLSINPIDLPKSGVANAITAIEGKIFAGTGDNASGVSYATATIANTHPPTGSVTSTFDGYKTNDVFGETGYGYIATDTNSKEIVILNLSSNPVVEVGSFDGSGSADANAVFVSGSVGYMTQGSNFRTFDLSSKSGSRSQLGSVTLAGTGNKIKVVGTYAYVAITGSSTKLQIIDISNPSIPSIVGFANPSGSDGQDVFVPPTGTRAYLVTTNNVSGPEMYIIDTTSKSGSRPIIGTYEASGMSPKAITVVTGNITIIVGSGGEEYQAISVANELSPVRCGGTQVDTGINGVASILESDGDAYSYIITGDSSAELKIIEGGPGGQYASSGTYESAAFDAGYVTAFNRVSFSVTTPSQTTASLQVAVADKVSGNCAGANYQFVGPDGTSSTFFTSSGMFPLQDDGSGFENPGQCLKYKVYLSTNDPTQTPVFSDITINYSP